MRTQSESRCNSLQLMCRIREISGLRLARILLIEIKPGFAERGVPTVIIDTLTLFGVCLMPVMIGILIYAESMRHAEPER